MSGEALFDRIASARRLPAPSERVRLRRALGIRQLDIAEAVGVSTQTVGTWERGRSEPSGKHRERYGELLAAIQDRLAEES